MVKKIENITDLRFHIVVAIINADPKVGRRLEAYYKWA